MNRYTVKIDGRYIDIWAENGTQAVDKAMKIAAYYQQNGVELPTRKTANPDHINTGAVFYVLLGLVVAGLAATGLYLGLVR